MPVLERSVYWRSVCIGEIYVLERCLYWKDICITEVSLLANVYIREASVSERCLREMFILEEESLLQEYVCRKSY